MKSKENIKYKLFNKLKEFNNDKDFVIGVISNLEDNKEDIQTVIDYIDNEKNITVETIILLSLHLNNERKNR